MSLRMKNSVDMTCRNQQPIVHLYQTYSILLVSYGLGYLKGLVHFLSLGGSRLNARMDYPDNT